MSQSRLFIKNFFSLMMGKAIVRLTSFASTLYLARVLGPAEFGQFSLALAIGFVLSFVTNLGLDNLIVREIARTPEKANRLLGDALILKTPVLPFGFLIALPFASAESRPLFLLLAGYGILHAYLLLFCAAFRGIERMEFQALILSVQIFLIAVGTIAAIWLTGEAIWAAVVHLVATAGVALWAYGILLRNGLRPSYRWQPLAWRQLLQTVLPFGLVIVGLAIYDRQGIALIKLLCGEAAAGWFNAAYSFIPILVNIPDIIINTLFPILSRNTQAQSATRICEAALKYTNAISFPLATALFALAPLITTHLFGHEYQNSTLLLRLLAPGLPFVFVAVILIGVLQTLDQQKRCAAGLWGALLVATPGCSIAAGLGNYRIGTLAYALSYPLLAGILFWLVQRSIGPINLRKTFAQPAIASLSVGLLIYLGQDISLPLLTLLALTCYALMLLFTGTIGKQEWALLYSVLQN